MRNSPPKVGVSFLHDFPDSTLALMTAASLSNSSQHLSELPRTA
jgi:hypothetical protein